jgi:hypothetical protein
MPSESRFYSQKEVAQALEDYAKWIAKNNEEEVRGNQPRTNLNLNHNHSRESELIDSENKY